MPQVVKSPGLLRPRGDLGVDMDPIANLFTAIENAVKAKKTVILVSASKMKVAILNILKEAHYVKDFKVINDQTPTIKIYLNQKIHHYQRVSRLSWRVYIKARQLPTLRSNQMMIISTPQGLMPAQEAKKRTLGGEVVGIIK